jgi:predicted transcriptional regulator
MHFDRSLIKILLRAFEPGEQYSTHSISHCCSSFNGNDNKPLLRKYLRHMEEKGYVLNHKFSNNIHKWSITQDGINTLKLLETDPFN